MTTGVAAKAITKSVEPVDGPEFEVIDNVDLSF